VDSQIDLVNAFANLDRAICMYCVSSAARLLAWSLALLGTVFDCHFVPRPKVHAIRDLLSSAPTADDIDHLGKLHEGGLPINEAIIEVIRVCRVVADFGRLAAARPVRGSSATGGLRFMLSPRHISRHVELVVLRVQAILYSLQLSPSFPAVL